MRRTLPADDSASPDEARRRARVDLCLSDRKGSDSAFRRGNKCSSSKSATSIRSLRLEFPGEHGWWHYKNRGGGFPWL